MHPISHCLLRPAKPKPILHTLQAASSPAWPTCPHPKCWPPFCLSGPGSVGKQRVQSRAPAGRRLLSAGQGRTGAVLTQPVQRTPGRTQNTRLMREIVALVVATQLRREIGVLPHNWNPGANITTSLTPTCCSSSQYMESSTSSCCISLSLLAMTHKGAGSSCCCGVLHCMVRLPDDTRRERNTWGHIHKHALSALGVAAAHASE